ncbi:MAG: SusC/RagA family TonB-linked outer membrane protein, partial [Bacteroidota bacterium]
MASTPQDIVAIEILKDASAAAIYGARGANGVVLITTRRGSGKKFTLDYSSSFSVQELDREYDMLNAEEFATVSNEISLFNDPDSDPIYSAAQINRAEEGTNWVDQITRLGTINQQQLAGSGGHKNFNYYISGNYFQHKGIVDGSELERISGRANLDYTKGKLTAGLNLTYSRINDQQVPFGANSNSPEFGGLFDNTRNWSPLVPVRDEDGNLSEHPTRPLIPNPVSLLDVRDQTKTNRLLASAYMEYDLTKGLKAKINLGRDQSFSRREAVIPLTVVSVIEQNGEGEWIESEAWSTLGEFTLTYNKELGNNSQLSILGGTTFQQFDNESNGSGILANFADQTLN